jgi:hypothetical protein
VELCSIRLLRSKTVSISERVILGTDKKYLIAVAFLAVLAIAFGVFGTAAPPLAQETTPVQPQQGLSSESVGHFTNPPTYDSGWVNITTKAGQYVTLKHGLNTTKAFVDITGKQSLELRDSGALAWRRTYGGASEDYSCCVIQTDDGGYALAGYTNSFGVAGDFFFVKTDAGGNMLWNKTYGGISDDIAYSVIQTSDGGYALAGYTQSFGAGDSDVWLVKTDSTGTMLWNKTYGRGSADVGRALTQTSDEGYAIGGYTSSFGDGYQGWLVKVASDGAEEWNKTYGGLGTDVCQDVVQTRDGGYALGGYTSSYGKGSNDCWLVKTDSMGNFQWNETYGGTFSDIAYSLIQTDDNGYALAGDTGSFGAGGQDFYLVKTDSAGTMVWNTTYGKTGTDSARSFVQMGDGGYALAGHSTSFGGGYESWLVRTNSTGSMLWNKIYGGVANDHSVSIVQTSDGGFALAGYTSSYGAGSYDCWLVKVNGETNLEHQRNLGGTILIPGWSQKYGGTKSDLPNSMVRTSDGGYAIAGGSNSFSASIDFWLVKTDSVGTILWSKTYGGPLSECAYSVIQTSDGGYALAGFTTSYGAGKEDFWLVKTDWAGNLEWSKYYGGAGQDEARSLVQTVDGGYALGGYTNSTGAGKYDFLLVKARPDGTQDWSRTYGGAEDDYAYSVIQTLEGGYALAGCTNSSGAGGYDLWMVKTNSTGSLLWSKTCGGTNSDGAECIVQSNDGAYALVGTTQSYGVGSDFWLVKVDSAGTVQLNKTYGGPGDECGHSLVQTGDGGYALAGSTNPIAPIADGADFWLVKTDSLGNLQWGRSYGTLVNDVAHSIVQTGDGGFAMVGQTLLWATLEGDSLLIKTDAEMGLKWTALTEKTITLYRCKTDLDWNYVRVRIWLIKEPTWVYGDINMDGVVDAKDLYILGKNYGRSVSLLSLSGIIGIAGIRTYKKRKQADQA